MRTRCGVEKKSGEEMTCVYFGSATLWENMEVEVVMLDGGKRTVMQVSVVFGVADTLRGRWDELLVFSLSFQFVIAYETVPALKMKEREGAKGQALVQTWDSINLLF